MTLRLVWFVVGYFCFCYGESKIKNTLLLVADDAGFEMGAYSNKYVQTPNLDNLARKSLIFNYAFTSASSCSPSRAQILTGLPSHQNGMYGLHQGVHHFNVFDSVKSLPNVLREHNVFTGIVGKKHVGPSDNFKFDYEQTEEHHSINQVGRNITNMKLYVRKFLEQAKESNKPFFLVVAFHDPHRCGHITPQFGEFCERWGSGEIGMGTIPDWKPIYYDWRNLVVPYYLPDTEIVKQEIAAQYLTTSRLDQGVGLMLKELESFGFDKDTFVMYTSDNGPPFPGGRTNFYDAGIKEPMIIFSPENGVRRNQVTGSMTSLLDIYPTILDVFKITTNLTKFTGKSLLPLLTQEPPVNEDDAIFGSQTFHEVTMMYPMRMIRTRRYKVIHNLNYKSFFPVDQDLYTSPTFQEILNATIEKKNLPWARDLKSYYIRDEWQMFDTKVDPMEKQNLYQKPKYKKIFETLKARLLNWQTDTADPWRCSPDGVLEEQGIFKENPQCLTLGHESL